MPKTTQNAYDEPDIPAHRSRHSLSLIGATVDGDTLVVNARIDAGRLKGKRLAHSFDRRDSLRQFVSVAGLPGDITTLGGYAEYLTERGASIRFSARIHKSVERWIPEAERWVEVESPPTEQARFRYRYRLSDFDEPTRDTELYLDRSFWERRRELEREKE